ncbi:MAG: EamA family transporter [Legionella sp.]|nr:EamA family transporter [Legionella sp.]
MKDYLYILATVFFTVYGQLIVKWRVSLYGALPLEIVDKLKFLTKVVLDPWILSGLTAAFLASITWILALTKFDLTLAYPLTSLNFVFILFLGGFIFNEHISLAKILGVSLIMVGTMVASRA